MGVRLSAATILLVVAVCAFAQDCPDPDGGIPFGWVDAVAAEGDHVFFVRGAGVQVADLTTPAQPAVVGQILLQSWPIPRR